MFKIPWVNFKPADWGHVESLLKKSFAINQLTNYGPVTRELELYFTKALELSSDKVVIAVVNAALGLEVLVGGINWAKGKKLRYATQAYTFPCSAQGSLQDSLILDIDDEYGLDLNQVPLEIDGLVVTNLFGHVGNVGKYVDWAEKNDKILIFDNATVPFTKYNGRNALDFGVGSIVSLHHTKPLGFGEGGLVIVDKEYESYVRKCINFGFDANNGVVSWHPYGTNSKMSEISASFILSYLQLNQAQIVDHQTRLYHLFSEKLKAVRGVRLFPNFGSTPFVSCFALICDRPITINDLNDYELNNITAKKYYTPLANLPNSVWLFQHILCLPCHLDVDEDTLDRYVTLLKKVGAS